MKNYIEFLGLDKIKRENEIILASSDNREILLSGKFYYPILITRLNNNIIISCSPKYVEDLKEIEFIEEDKLKEKLNKFAEKYFENFEIKEMNRLIKIANKNNINCENVELIDENKKQYFYNIVKKSKELKYKEQKWNEFNKLKAPFRN